MARRSIFPAKWPGGARPVAVRLPLAAGQTFTAGAAVTITANEVVEAGADPATIVGFAMEAAADVIEPNFVMVYQATDDMIFAGEGDNAPVAGDQFTSYGIVKDGDGIWHVDGTETVATVVHITEVDLDNNLYLFRVLTAAQEMVP